MIDHTDEPISRQHRQPADRPESSTRRDDRSRPLARVLVLCSVLVLATPVLAVAGQWEAKKADPFFGERGIDDRAGFFLDGVSSSVETTVQVNSEAGIGSTILLERLFEVPSERDYARFQFYYRFSRKHRLNVQYLGTSSSGIATLLDEAITIGDYTYEINARIGAQQKTRFAAVEYRYAFVNNGKAEAGIAAGLGVIDTNLQFFGEVTDSEGFTRIAGVEVNETIPLPVAGVYTDFTLTRRLFLSVETLLFSIDYDKYTGNVSDVRTALRWYPARIFGFGAAWNRTRIDVDIQEEGGDIRLDYLFDGPSVFISFLIPGLK